MVTWEWVWRPTQEGPPVVQLGDASMAAPFTAKATSVGPCKDLIRQGRTTLVTTIQMYKVRLPLMNPGATVLLRQCHMPGRAVPLSLRPSRFTGGVPL